MFTTKTPPPLSGAAFIFLPVLFPLPAKASAAAFATRRPFSHRASFVYGKRPAAEVFAIPHGNSFVSFVVGGHLNETETLGTSGKFIGDNCCRGYRTSFFKGGAELVLGCRPGQTTDVQSLGHCFCLLIIFVRRPTLLSCLLEAARVFRTFGPDARNLCPAGKV